MSREVRRVPPNWEHPKYRDEMGRIKNQPMHDRPFSEAEAEWLAEFDRIRSGGATESERECYPGGVCEWAAVDYPPPNPAFYQPWSDEEATWYQLWETVSEGTPVSPPFETAQELIDYLAENGDFWDQKRCRKPGWVEAHGGTAPGVSGWGHERAEATVEGRPYWITIGGPKV